MKLISEQNEQILDNQINKPDVSLGLTWIG